MQVAEHDIISGEMQEELDKANADCQALQSQLSNASHELHKSGTQLQASKLDMTYLKVRQQLSQAAPVLTCVQAYQVSCDPTL